MRISARVLKANRHISIALTDIFGIGRNSALAICKKAKIKPESKVGNLTEADASIIQKIINDDYEVEGDLRRKIGMDIKRLRDIKCYRGLRHRRNLPVRGQRTKTNAQTRKGKAGKGSVGSRKSGGKGSTGKGSAGKSGKAA